MDYIPKFSNAGRVQTDELGNKIQIMHNGLTVRANGYYGEFITQIVERLHGHHEP